MQLVTCSDCSVQEKRLKDSIEAWCRIWRVGNVICRNLQTEDVAPIYGVRRDHDDEQYDGINRTHVRSFCESVVSLNHRISYVLSMFLKPFLKLADLPHDNTEHLLYRIRVCNEYNNLSGCMIGRCRIIRKSPLHSPDNIDFTVEKCLELIMQSHIEFENLNMQEVGLYLASHVNPNLLKEKHLFDYCPTKDFRTTVPTSTPLGMHDHWIGWRKSIKKPDYLISRKMITIALDFILKLILNSNFCVNKTFYTHMKGNAIDVGVANDIANLYLVWWDRELKKELSKQGMNVQLYNRYGEHVIIVLKLIPCETTKKEKYTMEKVREIAKEIDRNINIFVDYPTYNPNGRLTVLDTEQWMKEVVIDGVKKTQIIHSHFVKAISSKHFVDIKSDTSHIMKMNILTNDLVRIMRNVSNLCSNTERISKVQEYLKLLNYYGYSKAERVNIYKRAKNRYDKMVDDEELDLYQSKFWNEKRKEEKGKQRETGHHQSRVDQSRYFEDAAHYVQMLAHKRYESIMKTFGLPVNVVTRCTSSVRNELKRSNPFRATKCEGRNCRVCTNVMIKSIGS